MGGGGGGGLFTLRHCNPVRGAEQKSLRFTLLVILKVIRYALKIGFGVHVLETVLYFARFYNALYIWPVNYFTVSAKT